MQVTDFLEHTVLPSDIVSTCAGASIRALSQLLSGFETSENIFEIDLCGVDLTADYSFNICREREQAYEAACRAAQGGGPWSAVAELLRQWSDLSEAAHSGISDVWLEFDYSAQTNAVPGVFIDASGVIQGGENDWMYDRPLAALLGGRVPRDRLKKCVQALPAGTGLFQLGVMLSRGAESEKKVRVFTNEMDADVLQDYLRRIALPTLPSDDLFRELSTFSDGKFIADFDVCESGLSTKMGVNFGMNPADSQALPNFLEWLCANGLGQEQRCAPLSLWANGLDRDISHFKLVFNSPAPSKAKAYLRQWPLDRLYNRRW